MITIALDEFGDFENIKADENEPVGVAGVLYDDCGNRADVINERKRIEAYYKACIAEAGDSAEFVYPEALHSNGDKRRDTDVVGPVKRTINATIQEFLTRGTYRGSELIQSDRRGCYYLFAVVKSDTGMSTRLDGNTNFLIRDDQGSNLYFHMATEVVNRTILYNPLITDIKEVSFNIATRRSSDIDSSSNLAVQYRQLGYSQKNSTNANSANKVYFSVANADVYRSVLSQEMIQCGKDKLVIADFEVRSIVYSHGARKMEFLYLADTICSFLSHVKGLNAEEWFDKITKKANSINPGSRNLIFGYDAIDLEYQNAWRNYENGDYYQALTRCFDAKSRQGVFANHYNKIWFDRIIKLAIENANELNFTKAVNEFVATIKTNKYEPDRSIFILKNLELMVPKVMQELDDTDSEAILYRLYNAGVAAYCHIGDSKKVISYYTKCKAYADRVSVEDYLETLNRMSETLIDNFEWKQAEKIAEDSLKYQVRLLEMKNSLPVYSHNFYMTSIGLGRAYSQLAQIYAFMRKTECEQFFRKALDIFDDKSVDYRITQSYLLQYYLDNNMREEYLRESEAYFGGEKKTGKQLDYIFEQGFQTTPIINYKYALYVYVRGLYCFRTNEISDTVRDKLYKLEDTVKKAERKYRGKRNAEIVSLSGHPFELVYKYISLIAIKNNDRAIADQMAENMCKCLNYKGDTLEVVLLNNKKDIAEAKGENDKVKELNKELLEYMVTHFNSLKKCEANDELMNKYITFMYR